VAYLALEKLSMLSCSPVILILGRQVAILDGIHAGRWWSTQSAANKRVKDPGAARPISYVLVFLAGTCTAGTLHPFTSLEMIIFFKIIWVS